MHTGNWVVERAMQTMKTLFTPNLESLELIGSIASFNASQMFVTMALSNKKVDPWMLPEKFQLWFLRFLNFGGFAEGVVQTNSRGEMNYVILLKIVSSFFMFFD